MTATHTAPIAAHDVSLRVGDAAGGSYALSDVSFEAAAGELVAVTGPSGSGKARAATRLRREEVALLLPDAPALSTITVRENVALPLLISGQTPEPQAIDALLELLRTAAHQDGIAVILFTRDPEVAAAADRSVRIEDGVVAAEIGARGLVAA